MGRLNQRLHPLSAIPDGVTVIVEAIVQHDCRVLLRRGADDRWTLPGRAHRIGESLGQTATRAVDEQTGLTVEIDDVVGFYLDAADQRPSAQERPGRCLAVCIRAHPRNLREVSAATQRLRWVAFDALDALPVNTIARRRIGHALQHRREPFIEPAARRTAHRPHPAP